MRTCANRTVAFTLIELLVVIGVIAVLASLLLPALTRGKQQSKISVCLNNLHQIDVGIEYYVHDHGVYPRGLGGYEVEPQFLCEPTDESRAAEMRNRSLYDYIKPSELFHCPEDKGENFLPDSFNFAPSMFTCFGCSYQFNAYPPGAYGDPVNAIKHHALDVLPGKTSSWVRDPTRYIMCYEPPAHPVDKIIGFDPCHMHGAQIGYYFHWHFHSGPTTVTDLARDNQRFISPILFVEGHAARLDFTKAIKSNPQFPFEETANWIWYQPMLETNRVESVPQARIQFDEKRLASR